MEGADIARRKRLHTHTGSVHSSMHAPRSHALEVGRLAGWRMATVTALLTLPDRSRADRVVPLQILLSLGRKVLQPSACSRVVEKAIHCSTTRRDNPIWIKTFLYRIGD